MLALLLKKYFKKLLKLKIKKNGQKKKKKLNIKKEEDMLNSTYCMIEVQNLDYKLEEILKQY